ncbi:MAG: hypothetical protein GF398_17905 [Chitinivibrionales bacterium]|nr:hypothetical protein [Chitinivibrionales bacterium]
MEPSYVKKTMFLNKSYIRKALRILNAKTEKEAVNKALQIVVDEDEIIHAHDEVGGADTVTPVYR